MKLLSNRYLSERDFVARYALPRLEEAARVLGVQEVLDFHVDTRVDGGIADLYADRAGRRLLVLEAKFKKKVGRFEHDIEPRDPDVVKQAVNYAVFGRFPFYLTCNTKRIVLYQMQPGKAPFESEVASFEYETHPNWAEEILKTALGQVPVRLKGMDDTLVDLLQEAFHDLYPEFLSALKQRLQDTKFKQKYVDWLEDQGLQLNDETNRLIAEQSCYLQLNKLLFYQVIRTIYPDRLSPMNIREDEDISEALARFYSDAKRIDYAAVYESDVISEIPFTLRAKERLRTLLDTLNEFDFSAMKSDFLGRVYEKLIPPLERKRLGQFYTPPGIVDFIVNLTIRYPNSTILDPGCGSGSFLVRAYHKLRELNGIPENISGPLSEQYHQQLLSQIYGVDINQFPAHLSVINLAVQNPRARLDHVNIAVKDFFEIRAGQTTLSGFQSITTEGGGSTIEFPSSFDSVVANPPYIRQELLGTKEKKKTQALIEGQYRSKLFIGQPVKKVSSAIILDRQSDIYIYFFIHGISLLKPNGRLGFISSNKWLEVGYGEPFQSFLLEYTKILYVFEFDRAIFPDAEVNTTVMILEKESDSRKRKENLVKFARMKQRMDLDSAIKLIDKSTESYENDEIRINVVKQESLRPGKWNVFLRAPPVFQKVVSNPDVRPLSELAEVMRAPTTGYNNFFILDRETSKQLKIEKKYLRPCLSSPKKIHGLTIEDTEDFMLMVQESKNQLTGTHVLEYIKHGEKLEVEVTRGSQRGKRNLPEVETLANRKPFWYSLWEVRYVPLIFPYMIDVKGRCLWNKIGATATDVFYYIAPRDRAFELPLLGYLNSTLTALLIELYGRSYGGGILKIQVYEFAELPTLDPNALTASQRKQLERGFLQLAEAVARRAEFEEELERVRARSTKERGLFEDEIQEKLDRALEKESAAQESLDEAIYDILGLSRNERKQIERGLSELQEIRRLRTQV